MRSLSPSAAPDSPFWTCYMSFNMSKGRQAQELEGGLQKASGRGPERAFPDGEDIHVCGHSAVAKTFLVLVLSTRQGRLPRAPLSPLDALGGVTDLASICVGRG